MTAENPEAIRRLHPLTVEVDGVFLFMRPPSFVFILTQPYTCMHACVHAQVVQLPKQEGGLGMLPGLVSYCHWEDFTKPTNWWTDSVKLYDTLTDDTERGAT